MFGFWSLLPISTSSSVVYNGRDDDIVLHVQKSEIVDSSVTSTITIDMNLQKDSYIII